MEAMFGHVKGEPYGRYAHSLGSKSTSTSDFLLGLAGCIVLSPPVRAVTVTKRREYIYIYTQYIHICLIESKY